MSNVRRQDLPSGIEMEYEEWGEGPRALVLAHGFTGSRDDWRERLPELAPHGRVLAIDHRGHGGSSNTGKRSTYTLDQLATDLRDLQDALDLGPIDLLGHSMGGMVALRFALSWPEQVASLILMDTSPYGLELAPRETLDGAAKLARMAGMRALAEVMREYEKQNPRMPEVTRRFVQRMGEQVWWERTCAKLEKMDPEAFAALGRALYDQEPVTERLGELHCPTTVIVGDQDAAFVAPSEVLADRIPGAILITLNDAGHNGQLEAAESWLEAVLAHLDRARAE